MEFKGTKGDWVGYENSGVTAYFDDDTCVEIFETGCGCCTSGRLDKYDALLISKAPKMLEMLQFILSGQFIDKSEIETLIKEATEL